MKLKLIACMVLLLAGLGAQPALAKPLGVIEPFMALPWGGDFADFIALAGEPDESKHDRIMIYHQDFMGMAAQVTYVFTSLSPKGKLKWCTVDCSKENISIAEAQDLIGQITSFIKNQMLLPKSIHKNSVLNYINDNVPDKITIFKDYMLDAQTAVLLFYRWWENENKLDVSFYFVDRYCDDIMNRPLVYAKIIADAEINDSYDKEAAQKMLMAEKKPFLYVDWTLNPAKFAKLKGKSSQEEKNWVYSRFVYEKDVIWSVPATTKVIFSRNYTWVGFKHMRTYETNFNVRGLDLAQAQTITKAFALALYSAMHQPYWREDANLTHGALGFTNWRAYWSMYDDETFAIAVFNWNDRDENYSVTILLNDIDLHSRMDDGPNPHKDIPLTEVLSIETDKTE